MKFKVVPIYFQKMVLIQSFSIITFLLENGVKIKKKKLVLIYLQSIV
jgi:hypothetical protein